MAIRKVGVVGCGLMGSGIAQICAAAGLETVVREANDEFLQKGLKRIEAYLQAGVERGKMTAEAKAQVMGRIKGTTRASDLADCDLVIEAIIENMAEKRKLFAELDAACKPSTIFASNTSSLPIIEMAAATKRADRICGLHFFNPVPLMPLVEVVKTISTSDAVVAEVHAFAKAAGKSAITTKDTPGFVVNLLLVPYMLDAIRALESGLATREDIDTGMKLGCGYPMGPLELLDFVGLDTTYYIANIMFEEFKDAKYAPPPLLKRLVLAGHYGKKTGKGFYDYTGTKAAKA